MRPRGWWDHQYIKRKGHRQVWGRKDCEFANLFHERLWLYSFIALSFFTFFRSSLLSRSSQNRSRPMGGFAAYVSVHIRLIGNLYPYSSESLCDDSQASWWSHSGSFGLFKIFLPVFKPLRSHHFVRVPEDCSLNRLWYRLLFRWGAGGYRWLRSGYVGRQGVPFSSSGRQGMTACLECRYWQLLRKYLTRLPRGTFFHYHKGRLVRTKPVR